MGHADPAAVRRGEVGRRRRTMFLMLPPESRNCAGEEREVDRSSTRRLGGQELPPHPLAVRLVGHRELDDEVQAGAGTRRRGSGAGSSRGSRRRRTAPSAAAGRRSRCWRSGRGRRAPPSACRRARRPRRRTAPRSASLGRVEDPLEVLLGLADVLADDRGQVDLVEVEPELGRRSTSAAIVLPVPEGPANSAHVPRAEARTRPKPQSPSTRCRCSTPVAQFAQLPPGRGREHEVVPAEGRAPLGASAAQVAPGLAAGPRPPVRPGTLSGTRARPSAAASAIRTGPSR